jgi:hypothetical protein
MHQPHDQRVQLEQARCVCVCVYMCVYVCAVLAVCSVQEEFVRCMCNIHTQQPLSLSFTHIHSHSLTLTHTHSHSLTLTHTANVIYLEQPSGVGFSYGGNYTSGDIAAAEDNYAFLQGFFEKFPEYAHNPLYITGESYAGARACVV